MTTLYKLTTRDWRTRKGKTNECLWGPGVSHSGTGEGGLCGPGWVHAYECPLLAALLNPIHADIRDPVLWECEGEVALRDGGIKVGCRTLTTLRIVPLPEVTTEQRVRFGILCALEVCDDPAWRRWAEGWLSGADRSGAAADAADAAATWAAAWTAAADAAATWAAAWAATAARAAADAAATWAAATAARAAAWAAYWAARTADRPLDLVALAEEATR